ncbi:MAG: hypothetical protein EHM52_04450, partial [Actinomycetota bacterium]
MEPVFTPDQSLYVDDVVDESALAASVDDAIAEVSAAGHDPFAALGLSKRVLAGVTAAGYEQPTP